MEISQSNGYCGCSTLRNCGNGGQKKLLTPMSGVDAAIIGASFSQFVFLPGVKAFKPVKQLSTDSQWILWLRKSSNPQPFPIPI